MRGKSIGKTVRINPLASPSPYLGSDRLDVAIDKLEAFNLLLVQWQKSAHIAENSRKHRVGHLLALAFDWIGETATWRYNVTWKGATAARLSHQEKTSQAKEDADGEHLRASTNGTMSERKPQWRPAVKSERSRAQVQSTIKSDKFTLSIVHSVPTVGDCLSGHNEQVCKKSHTHADHHYCTVARQYARMGSTWGKANDCKLIGNALYFCKYLQSSELYQTEDHNLIDLDHKVCRCHLPDDSPTHQWWKSHHEDHCQRLHLELLWRLKLSCAHWWKTSRSSAVNFKIVVRTVIRRSRSSTPLMVRN